MPGATVRGEDYYTTAQGMDILGITCYLVNRGPGLPSVGHDPGRLRKRRGLLRQEGMAH